MTDPNAVRALFDRSNMPSLLLHDLGHQGEIEDPEKVVAALNRILRP